jgi:hypothetical protein
MRQAFKEILEIQVGTQGIQGIQGATGYTGPTGISGPTGNGSNFPSGSQYANTINCNSNTSSYEITGNYNLALG